MKTIEFRRQCSESVFFMIFFEFRKTNEFLLSESNFET